MDGRRSLKMALPEVSFGSIMKGKKEMNKKERRSPFFLEYLATLYRVHVALLFVIHPIGNLCRTWKNEELFGEFPGQY